MLFLKYAGRKIIAKDSVDNPGIKAVPRVDKTLAKEHK